MHDLTTTLLTAAAASFLLSLIVATVRAARADERAWQIDHADRLAGVTYTYRDGRIERSGPRRLPGEPVGNLEAWARLDGITVRQSEALVQIKVSS